MFLYSRPILLSQCSIQLFRAVFILLLFTPSMSFCLENPEELSPYIKHHKIGWIDWDNGLIYGVGKGYLAKNSKSQARAKVTADVIASANIIKLAAGINLNDKTTIEALGKNKVSIQLKAFIKDKQHKQELIKSGKPHYRKIRVASLKGVSGLTSRLVNKLKSTPWREIPIKSNQQELHDEEEPWLIIDANKLKFSKLEPALFPKILSSNGEILYSVEMVDENALNQRGMARYVTINTSHGNLGAFKKQSENFLAVIEKIISTSEAYASSDKKKRRKRRQYIVIEAQNLAGLAKTNLVVSESDAQQLKKDDASSQILRKCRVVIVTSPPVGGIDGMIKVEDITVAKLNFVQDQLFWKSRFPALPIP